MADWIDKEEFFRNLTAYAAPEMVWDAEDIRHKLGEMKPVTIDPESLRPKWISVEDRLPEYDQVVLCYKDGRGVRIGKHMPATYADGVVAFKDLVRDYAFGATHWMPLPEPPKGE